MCVKSYTQQVDQQVVMTSILVITRNRSTGRAEYRMQTVADNTTVQQSKPPNVQNIPTVVPKIGDTRDVPFNVWCEMHRHQLRRMVRYIRSRLSHGEGVWSLWDWEGLASSLAQFAYKTSANRHKATPSIV